MKYIAISITFLVISLSILCYYNYKNITIGSSSTKYALIENGNELNIKTEFIKRNSLFYPFIKCGVLKMSVIVGEKIICKVILYPGLTMSEMPNEYNSCNYDDRICIKDKNNNDIISIEIPKPNQSLKGRM